MPQRKHRTGSLKPLRPQDPLEAAMEERVDALLHAYRTADVATITDILDELECEDMDGQVAASLALQKRLMTGRADMPLEALNVFFYFLFAEPLSTLEDIARSRSASDVMRLAAHRLAGWDPKGTGKKRVTFLKGLRDGDRALVDLARYSLERWPERIDLLHEILQFVLALPTARRQALATRFAEDLGPRSLLFLHALLHVDDPPLQQVVLGEVARMNQPVSRAPVSRLADTADDDAIRAAAMTLLETLGRGDMPEPLAPIALPEVAWATISSVSAGGEYLVTVGRGTSPYFGVMAGFLTVDNEPLKEVYAGDFAETWELRAAIEATDFPGDANSRTVREVPLEAARGAVALAEQRARRIGQPMQPSYELLAPLLYDTWPPPDDVPVTIPMLDDTVLEGDRRRIKGSDALLDSPFFSGWIFDILDTSMVMEVTEPPRGGKWTDAQYDPLIATLITPSVRATLRRNLRIQAWLLDHAGDTKMRDLALAVSASLVSATTSELCSNPFLRRMVEATANAVLSPYAMLDSLAAAYPGLLDDEDDDDFLDDDIGDFRDVFDIGPKRK